MMNPKNPVGQYLLNDKHYMLVNFRFIYLSQWGCVPGVSLINPVNDQFTRITQCTGNPSTRNGEIQKESAPAAGYT